MDKASIKFDPCVWGKERLPLGGLIKLRDLPHDDWHANTLYVLTERGEQAKQLAELARRWIGEVILYDDPKDIAPSIGSWRDEHAILTVWWD